MFFLARTFPKSGPRQLSSQERPVASCDDMRYHLSSQSFFVNIAHRKSASFRKIVGDLEGYDGWVADTPQLSRLACEFPHLPSDYFLLFKGTSQSSGRCLVTVFAFTFPLRPASTSPISTFIYNVAHYVSTNAEHVK
ncbi:hypothetical protein MTO96_006855 [Rhipicephalus appendiculatus]